jgi:hypothetical protein
MPFDLPTCKPPLYLNPIYHSLTLGPDATLLSISTQASSILYFFLSKNIRIARSRAYEQIIVSRGKGPDFWKPYVEEWDNPPVAKRSGLSRFASKPLGRMAVKCRCSWTLCVFCSVLPPFH